ncbi:PAS domain-containing sensor histidine kinase [Hyalangium rubrum]|uniref:histidine kinase n=1 Tax=Hyalangium rubrum TaxID=3103134 RepID=A0ABU5GZZ4_9BACT|nr:PAS domain S-box protein [Hyalangium sp. s54d21]MDY7226107.1 PAS domain S-box protein [Hyalangium sp. s54d21]
MRTPDFQQFFRLSPNPYMVVDRELRYVAANDAYLRVTASRLEDLLGRTIFELFPHDPSNPNNESARMLRASFERVLSERAPDTLALIPYRVPRHTEQGIVVEDRYWSATHTPFLDERGEVSFILQHTVDVTELQRLKQAVQEVEAGRDKPNSTVQMEAGVLLRAQRVQEANRTLDAERRHLLRLFEEAPGFMCFLRGPEHIFDLANRAYSQIIGHRDLIGKPIREALPELKGQGFYELLDEVFTTGKPFVGRGMQLYLQQHPGAPLDDVYVDFVYQPIQGVDGKVAGIFVQGHDITVQMRAQAALQESEARFRNMADHAPVMLWVTDPSGACIYLSKGWYAFTGQTEQTGLGMGWLSAVHPDDEKMAGDLFVESNARKVAFRVDYRLRRKDGEYRWAIDSAVPRFGASGEFLGYIGSVIDITDRKVAEEEARRLNQELEQRVQQRTAELVESNKELESFSYSVSHDLRAPLRHIIGFAELLEKRSGSSLDATSQRYMKTITEAARQGGKLVDDLLAFSRMGRAELKKGRVSLSELVVEVRRELGPEAEGRKIDWRVGALPEVQADPALLRLALKNLLSNALKYTRPRPEVVIEIGAREEAGEAHVWVRDNGVGFEMQYVNKLFGVFQRLHTAEEFEGTGIGLANVRRIISRHGGRTWAEGQLGQGATFHFTLPITAKTPPPVRGDVLRA